MGIITGKRLVKSGFTLLEMLVVMAIIAAMALIATPSLVGYFRQAEQYNRTEIAKTIYLTAQNQLTGLYVMGNLKTAYDAEVAGRYFTHDSDGGFTDELDESALFDDNIYIMLGVDNYPSQDIENAEGGYLRYLSKPRGNHPENALQQLLAPALHDPEIINDAILMEYNIKTGKVLSIFYSDDEGVTEFSYDPSNTEKDGIYGPRDTLYNRIADERDQGYYGVDYTGDTPPEQEMQLSVHLYDGYSDNQDDIGLSTGLTYGYRFNKPLYNIGNPNEYTQNVLYAEIFIEKSKLVGMFSLSLNDTVVIDGIDLSTIAENGSIETAMANFDVTNALIFRNDNPVVGNINEEFARFVWVLDYAGGDMSGENPYRYKYSISELIDGSLESLSDPDFDINVSITVTGDDATEVISNKKNPLFATEYTTDGTVYNIPSQNNIATARHLNNIRFVSGDEAQAYRQVEDINIAEDDGFLKVEDKSFSSGDEGWQFIMSPLPELIGSYSGLYGAEGGDDGAYTLQNLRIYNVNPESTATATARFTDLNGRCVGLFESLSIDAVVSHLMIVDPIVTVESTINHWREPDVGKYAGVVAGFSNGSIHHVTIMSNSVDSPVVDVDNNNPSGDFDATNMRVDFVGGLVGMVGENIKESAIHHILYLASAPLELNGSYSANYTRYNNPIVGTNLAVSNPSADNRADFSYADAAIADESCYYLVGELIRPSSDETTIINSDVVTNGLGQPISTNEMYEYMQTAEGEFYTEFVLKGGYSFVRDVLDVTDTTTTASTDYPYPYYGERVPTIGANAVSPETNLDFVWPIAVLEPFIAELLYYEIYANKLDVNNPEVGYYLVDPITGNVSENTLRNTDVEQNLIILNDGYTIRVNRPYTMLESEDITFAVNGVEVDNEIDSWLYRLPGNLANDDFSDRFRADLEEEGIHSILSISNGQLQSAIDSDEFGGDATDFLTISINDNLKVTINPLFAKAIYQETPTQTAQEMYYTVRTPRHLDNIGRYRNSDSHLSNYVQELNINLANYGNEFATGTDTDLAEKWSYNSLSGKSASTLFNNLKYNSAIYVGGSGMESAAAIIGTTHPFAGVFNGAGHSIAGYSRTATGGELALFAETTREATIQDLTVANFSLVGKGLTEVAAVVAKNSGKITEVTVKDSNLTATFYNYAASGLTPAGVNLPIEIGGVVTINSTDGMLENVLINNSTITRTEAGAGDRYAPNVRGAGGIIGENAGELINSGAVDTVVSVKDNYVGGLVGLSSASTSGEDGLIQNCYFHNNQKNAYGNPITPVNFDYDASTPFLSETPFFSIGGIVGGGVGRVLDTLYLSLAPSVDVTNDDLADKIYPLTDELANGISMSGNIYLSGDFYYSGTNWKGYDYNTMPAYGTENPTELRALATEFINRDWLNDFAENQLKDWQNTLPYPTAPGMVMATNPPYATNRPPLSNTATGSGTATGLSLSADILFDGEYSRLTTPGSSVITTLRLTNISSNAINIGNINNLQISISDNNLIDVTSFMGSKPQEIVIGYGSESKQVAYSFNDELSTNQITVNLAGQEGAVLPGEELTLTFALNLNKSFFSDSVEVESYYYYTAIKAEIGYGTETMSVTSDRLYIEPFISVDRSYNRGNPITEGSTFPVELSFTSSALPLHTQRGVLTERIPQEFTVSGVTLNSNLLTVGSGYNLISDPLSDGTLLILTDFIIPPDDTLLLEYTLTHRSDIGEFTIETDYDKTVFSNINTKPYTKNSFKLFSSFNVVGE